MSRRVLVTGGLGFLGASFARALLARGESVRVFDNGTRGSASRLGDAAAHFEIVDGDIRDAAAVRRAVEGMDAVCHFAFINGTRFFYERPGEVLEVGVKGIFNVVDACKASGVGELYVASSSEVYQTPPRVPTDETVPLVVPDPHNPRYSYGGGKILSELVALHAGDALHRVVVFRPHNVYGPAMGFEHVIPELVLRFRERTRGTSSGPVDLPVQGTGKETRAFIFVDDFTRGLLHVVDGGVHRGIYNIGTMDETAIEAVAREVAGYFGREVRIVPGALTAGSTPRRCPDTARLRALGFEPKVSLAEGVRATARWYDEDAQTKERAKA